MSDETRSRSRPRRRRRRGASAAPSVPGPAAPAAAAGPELGSHRWLILAVIGIAQLMVVLDGTVRVHRRASGQVRG